MFKKSDLWSERGNPGNGDANEACTLMWKTAGCANKEAVLPKQSEGPCGWREDVSGNCTANVAGKTCSKCFADYVLGLKQTRVN